MEILAAHAAAAGVDAEHIREILDCAACDDAVRILRECGRDAPALARVTERRSSIFRTARTAWRSAF